jgi:hypothetical protein
MRGREAAVGVGSFFLIWASDLGRKGMETDELGRKTRIALSLAQCVEQRGFRPINSFSVPAHTMKLPSSFRFLLLRIITVGKKCQLLNLYMTSELRSQDENTSAS